jgi:large subunit ribosomal protein L18
MKKLDARVRRRTRTRLRIAKVQAVRLTVHRTPQHIYAQIIDATGSKVLAAASSLEADMRSSLKHGGNVTAAAAIGKRIAERAKQAGVTKVAFDRAGFKYHGRIKALADAARENGLEF